METISNTQGSDGQPSERTSMLGNLAQRLQDGLRATVHALGDIHAQRLAALVESEGLFEVASAKLTACAAGERDVE